MTQTASQNRAAISCEVGIGVGPFGAGCASPEPIHHAQLQAVIPANRQPAAAHHLTGFAFLA